VKATELTINFRRKSREAVSKNMALRRVFGAKRELMRETLEEIEKRSFMMCAFRQIIWR
jgi:hypothetical protein